ncbi:hypothetical protein ACJMK2_007579 [Sinanodonta woodiana]|uniref:Uncharacterized protein n=1 Tax=Sinanodonta woodiana TaxID=1069815 RepID=A0ABD3VK68_SINWO
MVRKRSIAGENILHIACLYGHYDMVKHILTLYPDMLYELGKYYWSTSHYAAQGGNVRIMELLGQYKLPKKDKLIQKCQRTSYRVSVRAREHVAISARCHAISG